MTLEQLKALAAKAIPGPWKVDSELSIVAPKAPCMTAGSVRIVIEEIPLHMDDDTRDFIATFNPAVVLSLLECAEVVRLCVRYCECTDFKNCAHCNGARHALAKLKDAGVTI